MSVSDRVAAAIVALLFALLVGSLTQATRPTPAHNTTERSNAHLL